MRGFSWLMIDVEGLCAWCYPGSGDPELYKKNLDGVTHGCKPVSWAPPWFLPQVLSWLSLMMQCKPEEPFSSSSFWSGYFYHNNRNQTKTMYMLTCSLCSKSCVKVREQLYGKFSTSTFICIITEIKLRLPDFCSRCLCSRSHLISPFVSLDRLLYKVKEVLNA